MIKHKFIATTCVTLNKFMLKITFYGSIQKHWTTYPWCVDAHRSSITIYWSTLVAFDIWKNDIIYAKATKVLRYSTTHQGYRGHNPTTSIDGVNLLWNLKYNFGIYHEILAHQSFFCKHTPHGGGEEFKCTNVVEVNEVIFDGWNWMNVIPWE